MYIRDAQGQLRWIPSQAVAQATPMTHRQAIQNHLRNQIQREEWDRFNAPPPEDNIHFQEDPHQHYTGPHSIYSNNYSNLIYQGHVPADPPIPQVIHPTPFQRHPRSRSTNITSYIGSSDGFSKTRSMEYNDMKTVEEEFYTATNIDCMNTLFGSAIKPNSCNRLNISTDEVEFDDPVPSNFVQPEITNAFQCNGIRGPGKKFNYSYDEESNHIKAHEESLHIGSKTRLKKTQRTTTTPKNSISKNAFQFNANERQDGYVGSSKSSQIHNTLPVVSLPDRMNMKEVYPLEDVISSHDSYEELSYIVDTISVAKEKNPHGIDIIVKKIMTIKMEENDMSGMFKKRSDTLSTEDVDENYSKPRYYQNMDRIETQDGAQDNERVSEMNFTIKDQAELEENVNNIKYSKTCYNQNMDRLETRDGVQDNERVTETNFTIKDQVELEENTNNVCLKRIGNANHNISNEDYPSFDEPEPTATPESESESDNSTEINAQYSNSSTCPLAKSSPDGENRQREANYFPQVERMSSIKQSSTGKTTEHSTKMHMEHNITTKISKNGTSSRCSKRVIVEPCASQSYWAIEEVASC